MTDRARRDFTRLSGSRAGTPPATGATSSRRPACGRPRGAIGMSSTRPLRPAVAAAFALATAPDTDAPDTDGAVPAGPGCRARGRLAARAGEVPDLPLGRLRRQAAAPEGAGVLGRRGRPSPSCAEGSQDDEGLPGAGRGGAGPGPTRPISVRPTERRDRAGGRAMTARTALPDRSGSRVAKAVAPCPPLRGCSPAARRSPAPGSDVTSARVAPGRCKSSTRRHRQDGMKTSSEKRHGRGRPGTGARAPDRPDI